MTDDPRAYVRALLHRWLVEYNPLYLSSAALVLGGTLLLSRDVAASGGAWSAVGVAAVAEVYAVALVAGAAILVRLGHVRPAVMLGLLAVLYQHDLTLHTETSEALGSVGAGASIVWTVLAVAKLVGLARALRLRASAAAVAAGAVAAAGLAAGPFVLRDLSPDARGVAVGAWVFVLGNLARTATVTSEVALDAWGRTVLRRSLRATWLLSAALLAGHVLFWSAQKPITLAAVAPAALLVAVRSVRRERRVFALVASVLVVVATLAPGMLAPVAALAAAALALRAFLPVFSTTVDVAPVPFASRVPPYRVGPDPTEPPPVPHVVEVSVCPIVDAAERTRLLAGALTAAWLAVWTHGWTGGSWPAHVLAFDVAFLALAALFTWRARSRVPLVPVSVAWAHFVVARGLLPSPRTSFEWGALAIVTGFALLGGSVAATWRMSRRA